MVVTGKSMVGCKVSIHNWISGWEIELVSEGKEITCHHDTMLGAAEIAAAFLRRGAEWESCPMCFSKNPLVVLQEQKQSAARSTERIVEAAPDLYSALSKLHDCLCGIDNEYWDDSMVAAFNAATKALEKVDG